MIVKHEDLHCLAGSKRFCNKGTRLWFEQHGLDYDAFLRDGYDACVLLQTGDPRAEQVVEQARKRCNGGE